MRPENEAALAECVTSARGPLAIKGGGTRGVAPEGEPLSVAALSGIELYEPGALTLVAKAGTPVAEIEAALIKEGQRLAFEPADYRGLLGSAGEPTIGGVIATNDSGPRRIQGGAARDYALGVRFVDGQGRIIKNGGRVMKNVTGYDLVKVMCGAHGTLGVLTEVSLKVLPVPEISGSLMVKGLNAGRAVEVMSQALGSPYEVTGAAHVPKRAGVASQTALRIEGFENSVAYRLEKLHAEFKDLDADINIVEEAESLPFWRDVRDVSGFADAAGDVWRVSCRPSEAARLSDLAGAVETFFDWGGGRIWLRLAPQADLRARLGNFDGHATLVRAAPETQAKLGKFHPEPPGLARLSAGLRARFDPRGILNPGLMGPVAAEEMA
jgi:glycolate oxidase FAD binding subunit